MFEEWRMFFFYPSFHADNKSVRWPEANMRIKGLPKYRESHTERAGLGLSSVTLMNTTKRVSMCVYLKEALRVRIIHIVPFSWVLLPSIYIPTGRFFLSSKWDSYIKQTPTLCNKFY